MKSRGSRGLNKVAMHNAVYMYTSGEGHKVSIFWQSVGYIYVGVLDIVCVYTEVQMTLTFITLSA